MANTSTLKKIVAEAKRIQKAHPHMEWKNAIKDASKHIKEGAKTVIKKSSTKKGIGYKDDRIELLRKTTPIIRKLKDKGLTRDKAIKKIVKSTKTIKGISAIEMNRKFEYYEVHITRELLRHGKRVRTKSTVVHYTNSPVNSETLRIFMWVPFVENNTIFYRNNIQKYEYNSGEDTGVFITILIPKDNKFESHKRKAISIGKKLLSKNTNI